MSLPPLPCGLLICSPAAADANLTGRSGRSSFDEQQQQQQEQGKCPFLAALPTPPPARNAWWQRLQQLFSPADYQQAALGPHSMVAAPAQVQQCNPPNAAGGIPCMHVWHGAAVCSTVGCHVVSSVLSVHALCACLMCSSHRLPAAAQVALLGSVHGVPPWCTNSTQIAPFVRTSSAPAALMHAYTAAVSLLTAFSLSQLQYM